MADIKNKPFEVRKVVSVPGDKKAQISSIAFFEHPNRKSTSIYVGTTMGTVSKYPLRKNSSQPGEIRYEARGVECNTTLSKRKPVAQMVPVPGRALKLIALCDGKVTLLDLDTVVADRKKTFNHRHASCFCVHQGDQWSRLCVSSSKKLCVYVFNDSDGKYQHFCEINCHDVALSMDWDGDQLAVAFRSEYKIWNDAEDGGELIKVVGVSTEEGTAPCLKIMPAFKLPDGQHQADWHIVLFAQIGDNTLGIPVLKTGQPGGRTPLKWTRKPVQIAYSFPYVITLTQRGGIEIHNYTNIKANDALQTTSEINGKCLIEGVSAAGTSFKNNSSMIFVASANAIFHVQPVPYTQQIKRLVQGLKIDAAFTMFRVKTRDLEASVRFEREKELHINAGIALWKDLQFKAALGHFRKSWVDPREIMMLFRGLLPSHTIFQPRVLRKKDIFGNERMTMSEFIKVCLRRKDLGSSKLDGKVMEARKNFIEYLLQVCAKYRKDVSTAISVAVDTAILILGVQLKHPAVENHVANPHNNIDDRQAREVLVRYNNEDSLNLLAVLHLGRGHFFDALSIWRDLGNELGKNRTVEFLVRPSTDPSLVLQFVKWLLEKYSSAGMQVLMAKRDPENMIPPQKVLAMLRHDVSKYRTYLEHIVKVTRTAAKAATSQTPCTDAVLGIRRAPKIREFDSAAKGMSSPTDDEEELVTQLVREYVTVLKANELQRGSKEIEGLRRRLWSVLEEDTRYDADAVYATTKNDNNLRQTNIRLLGRLGKHKEGLALVLESEHRDMNALLSECERYCQRHCQSTSKASSPRRAANPFGRSTGSGYGSRAKPTSTNPFVVFLRMLFQDEELREHLGAAYADKRAYDLMRKYCTPRAETGGTTGLPALEVLESIPATTTVAQLQHYITMCFRDSANTLRQKQIEENLLKFNEVNVRSKLQELQSEKVELTQRTRCAITGDGIYEGMAFAVLPRGHPLHKKTAREGDGRIVLFASLPSKSDT